MSEEHQLTMEEAAEYVAKKDALNADFARTSYGLSPDDITLFDIVIDTGKVEPDTAVERKEASAVVAVRPVYPEPVVDEGAVVVVEPVPISTSRVIIFHTLVKVSWWITVPSLAVTLRTTLIDLPGCPVTLT